MFSHGRRERLKAVGLKKAYARRCSINGSVGSLSSTRVKHLEHLRETLNCLSQQLYPNMILYGRNKLIISIVRTIERFHRILLTSYY